MKRQLPNDKDNQQPQDVIRRQPAAVERIIGRQFEPDQIDTPTESASYDELPANAQAAVRAAWDNSIAERIAGLNLQQEFQAAGRPWTEADADGNTVVRQPDPPSTITPPESTS